MLGWIYYGGNYREAGSQIIDSANEQTCRENTLDVEAGRRAFNYQTDFHVSRSARKPFKLLTMRDARLARRIDKTWDTPLHYQLTRVTFVTEELSDDVCDNVSFQTPLIDSAYK